MTSLKTSHPSCTDAPLIEPLLLSWTTGATINVREGLREYVRVSMEFIEFLKTGKRSGVLDIGPTHESYGNDTRSPEQKNSIPHSIMRYWQVHVAPEVRFPEEEDGDSMRTKVDDRSLRYDEDGYSVQTRVNDGSIRYDEDDAYSMQTRVNDRFLRYDEEDADSVKTRGTR